MTPSLRLSPRISPIVPHKLCPISAGVHPYHALARPPTGRRRIQANGCVLVKTAQAVLVAEYEAPIQQTEATVIVEALADYFISVKY